MKQVKIRYEFLNDAEKNRKRGGDYRERIKTRMVGTSETKPCNVTSKRKENNLGKVVAPTEKPLSQKKKQRQKQQLSNIPESKKNSLKKTGKK